MTAPTIKQNDGARRLTQYLEERRGKLTSAALAIRCGILPQQLSHLRTGRRRPTLKQATELQTHARIPISSWLEP